MAQRLIVIAVSGPPKALERLEELIEGVVVEVTQGGRIGALTTEVLEGAAATKATEALKDAAGRVRRGGQ